MLLSDIRWVHLPLSLFGLWLLLVASDLRADEVLISEGADIYSQYCGNCHGPDRQGLAQYSGDLEALTERLSGVTEEMPDFSGFFSPDEISALYAYIYAPK
jgi:mono/diheme cytochrome c family protein